MGANAQTSVPAFTSGQVLTAAQVTQINTGMPVFASSTERDAAFGGAGEKTLAEGQMAYLEDTNETQVYDGSAWAAVGGGGKILQVVSTFVDTTFSTSSTSYVDVTGHTATITPTDATSKVLIIYTCLTAHSATGRIRMLNLLRDGSNICQHSGGTDPGTMAPYTTALGTQHAVVNFLDSPATTSAVVYKIQTKTDAGTVYIGGNTSGTPTAPANLTLMEVSA